MSQVEFMGMLVLAASGLLALISAIIVPLIKLNTTITRQNTMLESSMMNDKIRDKRLDEHGRKLDEHENKLIEHEVRLKNLKE